jgi:hypothetical protein
VLLLARRVRCVRARRAAVSSPRVGRRRREPAVFRARRAHARSRGPRG